MGDIKALVANALRDMRLARRYRQKREFATATLLYNDAIEKVLRALFINRVRRQPPLGASAGFLAARAKMPDDITASLISLQDDEEVMTELESESEISGYEKLVRPPAIERKVLQMDELATQLMDYVMAYAKA